MTGSVSFLSFPPSFQHSIQETRQRITELERGLSDGRAIHSASDDPMRADRAMLYRQLLRANRQYQQNLDHAVGILDATDGAISQIDDLVATALELRITGLNDTLGPQERAALATQLDHLIRELVDLGNQESTGVYLFGGGRSTEAPYRITQDESGWVSQVSANPAGIEGETVRQVTADLSLSIRISGSDLFGEGQELFGVLIDLRDALLSGERSAIEATGARLEESENQVLASHALIGSLQQRAGTIRTRLGREEADLEAGRAQTEDLDLATALFELNQHQLALEAALAAGSRILEMSLLEYIR